jgi:hypothetical protein
VPLLHTLHRPQAGPCNCSRPASWRKRNLGGGGGQGTLRLAPGYWAVGAQAMTTGACNLQKYRTRSAPVAAVMCDVCDVRPTPFVHFAKVCIRGVCVCACVCVRAFLMCAIAWCVYGVCVCLLDVWCQCHRPEPAAASAKVVTGSSPLKKTKRQSSPFALGCPRRSRRRCRWASRRAPCHRRACSGWHVADWDDSDGVVRPDL